jgi:AcrR family transcriptional regulator
MKPKTSNPRSSQTRLKPRPTPKSEETRTRILESALAIFRERGFDAATMRDIATHAGVATGAAYYYFESKDAIVMAFYQRAQQEMNPAIDQALTRSRTLEARLRAIIQEKFDYFAANRPLLATLSSHTNPQHPLSPFSDATAPIREQDIAHFDRAVADSGLNAPAKLPPTIQPYLARLLWMYQMGLILFWVFDRSPRQRRTTILFDQTLKMLLLTLRLAGLPFLRPMHRLAADLLKVIYENPEEETANKER